MSEPMEAPGEAAAHGLAAARWEISYRTSSTTADGRAVDILHDFYVPALRLSVRYDRVAGYFRSSSLAVASQGFSAFVGREGKARFVVGADLAAGDVEAILEGSEERLERALDRDLFGGEAQWSDPERRGVELLAWMVAHGHLEVRVALRVHGETGKPIPFSSSEDGYVHEKWALFHDEHGNTLHAAGSLNESKTSLTLNAENLVVHCSWWGGRESRHVSEAAADFETLWSDQHPHLRVLTIPEALRQKLIDLGRKVTTPIEVDGSSAAPPVVEPPPPLERLRFALLADGPKLPRGRLVGLETSPVEPWPHQRIVARRLVEHWPLGFLLCDEVGLGKTIEAGLAIRALHLSGWAKRVLIAAPASLTQQWQRELASKFLLPFARVEGGAVTSHVYEHPCEEKHKAPSTFSAPLTILSTGLLVRPERLDQLRAADAFAIALVDEAHFARRKNSATGETRESARYGRLYRALQERVAEKAHALWLATATPMQLHPIEAWDLARLLERTGAFGGDPSLTLWYYAALGRVVRGMPVEEHEWTVLRRAIRAVEHQDPPFWRFVRDHVIDAQVRLASGPWLDQGQRPVGVDLQYIRKLIFTASPLGRVMMRHTRSLLEIYRSHGELQANLARRTILPVPAITMTPHEREVYDGLEAYCRELMRRMAQAGAASRSSLGFYLSFLRLRFASSLYALRETLRRRKERVRRTLHHLDPGAELADAEADELLWGGDEEEDLDDLEGAVLKDRTADDLEWELGELDRLLGLLGDLSGTASKMRELLGVLDLRREGASARVRQTVIFTRFADTMDDIVDRLRRSAPELLIGTYSGGGGRRYDPRQRRLIAEDRERVKQEFLRGGIDVLVCTDAAAEGLNLQTADLLINFDLPWNPMKVEQRVGRIDRIGQRHDEIRVLNLCYVDSAEQVVYDRLLQRLGQALGVVGTQQFTLLPIQLDDFQRLAAREITPDDLEREALERLKAIRERTASMEIPPEDLYASYRDLGRQWDANPAPVTLDAIWETLSQSRHLRQLGCVVSHAGEAPTIEIHNVPGVEDGALLTISRELYERGLPGSSKRVHFASYGDPAFDSVLDHLSTFDLPAGVERLRTTEKAGDDELEMVAYAVRGETGPLLVTGFGDLPENDPAPADGVGLGDAEAAEALRRQLRQRLREEARIVQSTDQIARLNRLAELAQTALVSHVAGNLVARRQRDMADEDRFPKVFAELEDRVAGKSALSTPGLSRSILEAAVHHAPFDLALPQMGTEVTLILPGPLVASALDAAARMADSFREAAGQVDCGRVVARLQQEAAEAARRLATI
jgi:superfamily II DNA or RNA helicase